MPKLLALALLLGSIALDAVAATARHYYEFLRARRKKLFIQLQDVSFYSSIVNVPQYLGGEPEYNGGAAPQYELVGGRDEGAKPAANMAALRQAFERSTTMKYANFVTGEWLPWTNRGYLDSVYNRAEELAVGVGGPDLLPYREAQMNHSYPRLKASSGKVPTGIAVQDGNYAYVNPKTGERVKLTELLEFATEFFGVEYVFWAAQEPYYKRDALPFLNRQIAAP